jgi:hypothetical protein
MNPIGRKNLDGGEAPDKSSAIEGERNNKNNAVFVSGFIFSDYYGLCSFFLKVGAGEYAGIREIGGFVVCLYSLFYHVFSSSL